MNLESFEKTFSTIAEIDQGKVKKHIQKLAELDQYLPKLQTFILVQNTSSQTYEFVCDNYEALMGYKKEDILKEGMKFNMTKTHPEDFSTWLILIDDLMKHTMKYVAVSERINCVYYWNYRTKHANGKYLNVQVHQTPLYFDEMGKPIIGYSQTTVLGNTKRQPIIGICKKLNDKKEFETLYYKNYSEKLLIDNI